MKARTTIDHFAGRNILIFATLVSVLFASLNGAQAARDIPEDAHVDWDETLTGFVDYPEEAKKMIARESQTDPVQLQLFAIASHHKTQPLWALLKGIVYRNFYDNINIKRVQAFAYYYVESGVDFGCREADDSAEIVSDKCTSQCTHHGRYCSEDGAEWVKETLRRLCVEAVLSNAERNELDPEKVSGGEYFHYLEIFEKANCYDAADITSCSVSVMETMASIGGYLPVADCIDITGDFDEDSWNDLLRAEIRNQKTRVNPYKPEDLPALKINDIPYEGQYTTRAIFQAVCEAFPKGQQPLSCEFCSGCNDVRRCLWQWQCDGEPFRAKDFKSRLVEEEEFGGIGLIFGVIAGSALAACFAHRMYQARRVLRMLEDSRDIEINLQAFKDDPDELEEILENQLNQSLDVKHHGGGYHHGKSARRYYGHRGMRGELI